MRGLYGLILILCFVLTLNAQDLVNSRRSSYYTFIYKIDDNQAIKLYDEIWSLWDHDKTLLRDLFDFYPTDSTYRKELPIGHYLFVKSVNGDLKFEVVSKNNLNMTLLDNHRDLVMVFNDSTGREIDDVTVEAKGRKVRYQKDVRAYRTPKSNKRGIVSASYQGHVSYFEIDRRFNNTFPLRTGKAIIGVFPINHLVSPIFYLKNTTQELIRGGGVRPPGIYYRVGRIFKPKEHKGYIVFNKPKYKPNDTVRVKSFIATRKGKPVGKKADVFLCQYYPGNSSKKIITLEPYRKGAYQFEFQLHDSLKMDLDNNYWIEFHDRKGNLLLSNNFKYEDYELKQNTYTVRSDVKLGTNTVLYLKGVDSNDMPLYDVRVEVLLKPKEIKKHYASKTFVSDTLWYYQTKLDPIGETRINLPDSVMPPVALKYEAIVTFSNSENDQIVKTLELDYDRRPFPFALEIKNDSLVITAIDPKEIITGDLILKNYDPNDNFTGKAITIPHREKVNYFTDMYDLEYRVENTVTSKWLDPGSLQDQIQVMANRTKDSLFIVSENPRKIPFRYFLFCNQKLMLKGETGSLSVKRKAGTSANYTLSVQYIWAGKAETREYEIPFDKRNLDIKLNHPSIVYPGQKTKFTISVHDAFGKAVDNVDLTAYAITKKFTLPAPTPALFFREQKSRKIFNEFNPVETDLTLVKTLDWSYWKKVLGLDSLTFYKFLFPDSGYFEFRSKEEQAQFAPFVVSRGDVVAIEVIYVDGQPVYYKGVGTMEPYSFKITPGKHRIELRLRDKLITIDQIRIEKDQKLIFSIDKNYLPANTSAVEMPNRFTEPEISKLSRYFILVEPDVKPAEAYIRQGDSYHVLSPRSNSYWYEGRTLLAGPFLPGKSTYVQKDRFQLPFDYRPFLSYKFREGSVKLKDVRIADQMKEYFDWETVTPSFSDEVRTLTGIENYWKNLDKSSAFSFRRFPDFEPTTKRIGTLTVEAVPDSLQFSVRATFMVNLGNPDDYFVVPGSLKNTPCFPGTYQAVLIFSNEQYLKVDSIVVRPYGTNYYHLRKFRLHDPDSFSSQVIKTIRKWSARENYSTLERQLELQQVRTLNYQGSSGHYLFDHLVTGRVLTTEDESSLPGVNVIIKDVSVGTVTNADGFYEIWCPENATLVFSFIGFKTEETAVGSRNVVDVSLMPDVAMLQEVVVVGYATQSSRSITSSVTTMLSGRLAGVAAYRYHPGTADSIAIRVRGLSSVTAGNEPLVILDGVVVRLQEIDKSQITAMEILKTEEATAIYGSRGSNGVILISTKAGATRTYLRTFKKTAMPNMALENIPGNSLRKNFRDYAFWRPALKTDENGKAEFEASFPDDITGWNAYVLGIGSRKRTGQTSSTIQSYKPLIAQVAQPAFMIEGDSAMAVGKITSYSQEEITVERTIRVDGRDVAKNSFAIKNSKMDSIPVNAGDADSISVYYSVTSKGYTDGELRKIPVYRRGIKESIGEFLSFRNDTTVTFTFDKNLGPVKLYAQANLYDVFLDEIRYLRNYEYECNEQLASKLWALLLERQIMDYRGEKFKGEREARKIIRKLIANQNEEGSWGWWSTSGDDPWITLHVARCLLRAQKEKYDVVFRMEEVVNYIQSNLGDMPLQARLDALRFLQEQGVNVRAGEIADSLKKLKNSSVHEKLTVQRMLQGEGKTPDWSWINSIRSETVKGNYYWGEESQRIDDNAVINTLLVYKMMEIEKGREKELAKIRDYFLEKRKRNWRNTYESSLILEALLPRLLAEKKREMAPKLQLSGMATETIGKFPYEGSVPVGGSLTVSKTGQSPVYFTAYQERWNPEPTRSEKDFVVTTTFEDDPKTLRAGKPVKLVVKIEVKRDAEYTMIEVPIPAGCSYESKPQPRTNGEVHREYYHNKTNIYCEFLKKGVYLYSISLLPRYSGKYTLNPAVIQSMYFPTIHGRESLKTVRIE